MKKKKKRSNGFTLIELLAVIVLLITISAIAIPSITASIERSKQKQNEAKYKLIAASAEVYYANNKNVLVNFKSGSCYIPVNVLGLTDEEMTDAYGDPMTGGVMYEGNTYKYYAEPSVGGCVINEE